MELNPATRALHVSSTKKEISIQNLSLEQTIKREMIAEFTNTINPSLNDIEQLKGKIWKKATHISINSLIKF
jgi:hypothetical protein